MITTATCCWHCKAEIKSNREPVTFSGWYGNHRYSWTANGTLKLVDVACDKCKPTSVDEASRYEP